VADLKKMKVALVGEDGDGNELSEEEFKNDGQISEEKARVEFVSQETS